MGKEFFVEGDRVKFLNSLAVRVYGLSGKTGTIVKTYPVNIRLDGRNTMSIVVADVKVDNCDKIEEISMNICNLKKLHSNHVANRGEPT